MNYISQIPTEIKYLIFSYLQPDDLFELYSLEDPEYNQILSNEQFWFVYFLQHELPIMKKGNNFITWYNEYVKTLQSYGFTRSEIKGNIKFDINIIYPIELLQEYLTEKQIMKSLINNDYLIFRRGSELDIYVHHDNMVKLSTDKSKIFDLLFKLIYYGNYPEIFGDF